MIAALSELYSAYGGDMKQVYSKRVRTVSDCIPAFRVTTIHLAEQKNLPSKKYSKNLLAELTALPS